MFVWVQSGQVLASVLQKPIGDSLCTRSVQLEFILQVTDSSLKWYQLGRKLYIYIFFRICLTPCSLLAQWVARKLSKWTCVDRDILCRAPVAIFLSPEKIRFRHLQSSANISNPQTKICSLIARKTYTRKVNITAIPYISGWPFETHEKVRFSSWNQPSKSFVLEEYPSIPSV